MGPPRPSSRTAPPAVDYDRLNPATFSVAASGTGVLALTETYAPGWRRVGANAEHASVQGWMNAWPLDGAIDTTLTYAPAHRARLALYLFPLAGRPGSSQHRVEPPAQPQDRAASGIRGGPR